MRVCSIRLLVLLLMGLLTTGCSDDLANGSSDGDSDGSANNDAGDSIQRTDGGSFSDEFEECTGLFETARNTRGPADLIIAIDNTPSMYNEIEEVRANMNRLSQMVAEEGLDLHIVLISCYTLDCLRQDNWHTICIDPPVGAADACRESGDHLDDSHPPEYLHVDSSVESTKGLESIIDTHGDWGHMIRDNAAKHVVIVSDDNDDWSAEQFNTAFLALDNRFEGYQFHGIFAYQNKDDACAISEEEPCCIYAAPDGEGVVYKELVQMTTGVSGDMCLQDFDPVFNELATAVIESARLSCEWAIPDPPEDQELNPALVNVKYSDGAGNTFLIGRITSADKCNQVEHAWYYDDPDDPSFIRICPQTCDWIQGKPGATIEVQFGCETVWVPET
ncbi:MAG TPA: hypothetical protein VM425_04485 [Myxococcota bacterium]|nr:hypothetical protein [Myxococcota bacterium]